MKYNNYNYSLDLLYYSLDLLDNSLTSVNSLEFLAIPAEFAELLDETLHTLANIEKKSANSRIYSNVIISTKQQLCNIYNLLQMFYSANVEFAAAHVGIPSEKINNVDSKTYSVSM